jgi:guanidinoacetate N-methyltransferase
MKETDLKARVKSELPIDPFADTYPQSRENWQHLPAKFINNELEIGGLPVMARFEEPYMQELAKIATSNGGRILEIGFGMGISANFIQQYDIEEHIIVEANADIFKNLEQFAKTAKHPVKPIFGFWEDIVNSLPLESFDGILFDPMPLSKSDYENWHIDFVKQAYSLLKKGGIFTQYSAFLEISSSYRQFLEELGFSKINGRIVQVDFPKDSAVGQAQKEPVLLALTIVK